MKKTVLLSFFAFAIFFASAQELDVTHFLRFQAQHYSDPARLPESKFYLTMPALGNLHFGFYNSSIRYNKIFETDAEGYPVKITPITFVNSLSKKNNYLNFSLDEEILAFGLRVNNLYVGFDYRIRTNFDITYSRDLLGFFINGNMNYLGPSNAAQMEMGINVNAYNEFSAVVGVQLDKLSIGVRPKVLVGLVNAHTNSLAAQIYTNPDDYSIFLTYEADALLSYTLPPTWKIDLENMEFDFPQVDFSKALVKDLVREMLRNKGFGFDAGVRYNLMKKLSLGASMLDIGFIKWNANTYKVSSKLTDGGKYYDNGGFLFKGLTQEDIEDIRTGNFDAEALLDSLKTYFPLNMDATTSYMVGLQPRLVFQADYDLLETLRFSAVAQGYFLNSSFRPSFTLAVNKQFVDFVDICVA